jgi:hypothetical protein
LAIPVHLVIRSSTTKSGLKGYHPNKGRYKAKCDTASCRNNHLGTFDTPEEAAQAYLQHREKEHAPAVSD